MPTRSLVLAAALVGVLVAGGTTLAIAAGGTGPVPAAKPLAQAIRGAVAAPPPEGVTARIKFTNRLFPSTGLESRVGSALMSGASGRLWARNDGRGRLELQSSAGDVQVVWNQRTVTVYDASSNSVYKAKLPTAKAGKQDDSKVAPFSLAQIRDFLNQAGEHATLSGAVPANVAGREAYTVTASPRDKRGLLDSIRLAWDAVHGTPLRAAIYAKGSSKPVLALEATHVAYGPVPAADVDVAPPAGAREVHVAAPLENDHRGKSESRVAGFVAPKTLLGLKRSAQQVRRGKTAVIVYGEGLGSIFVAEQKGDGANGQLSALPSVRLDGTTGHELATPLGTILQWRRNGVSYLLAGSIPAATAEAAANGLR